ncbi:hypothetical protein [Mesotoga sp. UBA6090]|uniref:hypothetical protein n=1 Tax=Mesotoga sp. UBA6090 TaxID=1946860 RepID=UPI0025F60D91|nr:hypothetical protein [Mesotoga sp. UBA6090]
MPGKTSGEVKLLRRKPLRYAVNGCPSSYKNEKPGLGSRKSRSEAASQEVMPGGSSGEVRPTSSGGDAASQEAKKSQSGCAWPVSHSARQVPTASGR